MVLWKSRLIANNIKKILIHFKLPFWYTFLRYVFIRIRIMKNNSEGEVKRTEIEILEKERERKLPEKNKLKRNQICEDEELLSIVLMNFAS